MLSSTEWLQKSLAQILEESLRIEEPSVPRIEEPTQIVKDVKVCQKARFLRILDKVLSETSSVNDLRPAPQDAKCENCQKVTALASPIYLPMLSICINKCYPCQDQLNFVTYLKSKPCLLYYFTSGTVRLNISSETAQPYLV